MFTFNRKMSTTLRKGYWSSVCLLIAATALAGCAASHNNRAGGNEAESGVDTDRTNETRLPERDAIRYYIGQLADRDYVETYGGDQHPRPWYTAAEALGEIGKPAIPALIEQLDTPDPYELKLALYALMLASQDPALQAETGGDYLRLGTVLTQEANEENRRLALDWWQRYRHLWPQGSRPECV